jgi:hypothetical protein
MCIIRMPPAPHWSQTSTLFHAANRQQAPVHLNGAEACLGKGVLVRCNRPSPVVEPAPHPLCYEGRKAGSYCAVGGPGNNSSSAGCWGWDLQKKMGSRNIALQTEVWVPKHYTTTPLAFPSPHKSSITGPLGHWSALFVSPYLLTIPVCILSAAMFDGDMGIEMRDL